MHSNQRSRFSFGHVIGTLLSLQNNENNGVDKDAACDDNDDEVLPLGLKRIDL